MISSRSYTLTFVGSLYVDHLVVDAQPIRQSICRWWLHTVLAPSVGLLECRRVEFVHAAFVLWEHLDLVEVGGVVAGNCLLVERALKVGGVRRMLSLLEYLVRVHGDSWLDSLTDDIWPGSFDVSSIFDGGDWVSF